MEEVEVTRAELTAVLAALLFNPENHFPTEEAVDNAEGILTEVARREERAEDISTTPTELRDRIRGLARAAQNPQG